MIEKATYRLVGDLKGAKGYEGVLVLGAVVIALYILFGPSKVEIDLSSKLFPIIAVVVACVIGVFFAASKRNQVDGQLVEVGPEGIRFLEFGQPVWHLAWDELTSVVVREYVIVPQGLKEAIYLRCKDGTERRIVLHQQPYGEMPDRKKLLAHLEAAGHPATPERWPKGY